MRTNPSSADEVLQHAHETKRRMDNLMLQNPPIEIPPDSIWVIDAKSGCFFRGTNLTHTDKCMCDEDFDTYRDSQR